MTETVSWHLLGWLWRDYLRRYWRLIAVAMLLLAIEGASVGALSYMMKPMFDDVFLGGNTDALLWVGLAVMGIFVLRAITSVAGRVVLTHVSQSSMGDMRQAMLSHFMRLEPAFHSVHGPGYLIQRIEADVTAIGSLWQVVISGAGRDVVALISLFAVALWIDWVWTLIALIGAPVLVAPAMLLQRYIRGQSRLARDIGAALSVRLSEVFQGIVPVQLNALERFQAARYKELTQDRVRRETRSAFGQASMPGLVDVMSGFGFFAVVFYGGSDIISGEKTVGDFMAFFTAIGLAFEPLRRLGNLGGLWQMTAASIERIKELLETPSRLIETDSPSAKPDGVPAIRFEDVHLSYGGSAALRGATFTAEAGQTTALVGPSGAGKTTVFNLITRLVDAESGRVLVDETAVGAMRIADLRSLISVVSQDAALFDETIRDNITLDQEIGEERLATALEAAFVADFLPRLDKGLDTRVGPRGSNLSGGQRQRIAIARALLRDTPVLLLDEATSALDAQSEAVVQAALDRLSAGRTTLVIAHRLSTVRNADKIVVMEAGRVVDEGTHDTLMARPGPYRDLYALQSKDAETPG